MYAAAPSLAEQCPWAKHSPSPHHDHGLTRPGSDGPYTGAKAQRLKDQTQCSRGLHCRSCIRHQAALPQPIHHVHRQDHQAEHSKATEHTLDNRPVDV